MNVKFMTNDYILAWNLLFKSSITQDIKNIKQKIWNNYRLEYNSIYPDKQLILSDPKNFIPDNDAVYNMIFETRDFNILKKNAEKFRMQVVKLWDKNIKNIDKLINKIIRKAVPNYTCCIVNQEFSIDEINKLSEKEGRIVYGRAFQTETEFLTNMLYEIIKKEINIKEIDKFGVTEAVIEMAILNEFATYVTGYSCYEEGNKELYIIKKQIYPYWLMYLGISKEDMIKYMVRDKIAFQINGYAYEKELINMNIEEFIEFIIRNERYIIKVSKIDKSKIIDEVI